MTAYAIPVSVPHVLTRRPYSALLRAYVKALTTSRNSTQVRAMLWLEPELHSYAQAANETLRWARLRVGVGGVLSSAPETAGLGLVIESSVLGISQPLEVTTWPCVGRSSANAEGEACELPPVSDAGRPIGMADARIDLGLRALATDGWRLRVTGAVWRSSEQPLLPLSRALARSRARETSSLTPRVVHVSHPAPRVAFSTRALRHHVVYHRALGVAGTVAYATEDVISAAERDPALVRLAAKGALRLVRWTRPLANGTTVDPDAAIAHGHAVLSFWGSDARLLLTDSSELIATPFEGSTIPSLLEPGGCLDVPCAKIARFAVYPSSDPSALPHRPLWLWGHSTAKAVRALRWHQTRRELDGHVLVDPEHVASVTASHAAVCLGDLGRLDLARAAKGTAKPARSPCRRAQRCIDVPSSCVKLLDQVTLFGKRGRKKATDLVEDDRWMWAAKRI